MHYPPAVCKTKFALRNVLISLFFTTLFVCGSSGSSADTPVARISTFPHSQNYSIQTLQIELQFNHNLDNDDYFEGKEIKIMMKHKSGKILETISVPLDRGYSDKVNHNGRHIGITEWVKSDDGKSVQITGYISDKANGCVLVVEEVGKFGLVVQSAEKNINFQKGAKFDVSFTSVDQRKGVVVADTFAEIKCTLKNGRPQDKPQFKNKLNLSESQESYDVRKKELKLHFRASKKNHNQVILCFVGNRNKSVTIKVLHAPSTVHITPTVSGTVSVGSHLLCHSADGYPPPKMKWEVIKGPRKANSLHEIRDNGRTFVLKETSPIRVQWTLSCKSKNDIGRASATITFTSAVNQSLILMNMMKLEERVSKMQWAMKNFTKEMPNTSVILKKIAQLEAHVNEMQSAMKNVTKKISSLSQGVEKNAQNVNMLMKSMDRPTAQQETGGVLWIVRNFTQQRQGAIKSSKEQIQSDYFYSHPGGYFMRLFMQPNGFGEGKGTHISVFFQICKGPFDDNLLWPMKKLVHLAVINSLSKEDYKGVDYSYDTVANIHRHIFNKPSEECNIGLGAPKFVSWANGDIQREIGKMDTIVIRCIVT